MKVCFFIVLITTVAGFIYPNSYKCQHIRRHIPHMIKPQNKGENNLYNIDIKIQKSYEKLNNLRNQKRNILRNIPGLKLQNNTEPNNIYKPYQNVLTPNKYKSNKNKVDEDLNDLDDDDLDDDDLDDDDLNDLDDLDDLDDDDLDDDDLDEDDFEKELKSLMSNVFEKKKQSQSNTDFSPNNYPGIRIFRRIVDKDDEENTSSQKSDNFQVLRQTNMNFTNIGGYDTIKNELMQCADLLVNANKYARFNVRVPKGLILEGPPGNGKTLLAKCFSGELNVSFIPVSGAQFQEKYVGVGASRIRELFKLAADNTPCIIFIDEIDALGRKRSDDDASHNAERDTTLNELLVALDGFQTVPGVFLLASTNRLDLLDAALTRPGRIDKSVYVGSPDANTRKAIINIHIQGKPYDTSIINIDSLVELTQGCSGAQIENILNEAMLLALRDEREVMTFQDLEFIMTRIMVGWQTTENTYTNDTLYRIAIHEMGHAIVGSTVTNYNKLKKVCLNVWSPKNPGFTLFEHDEHTRMQTKSNLFSHLMVLLSGRIAEEVFFQSVSTGASHDLEQARKIAEDMITHYGMGNNAIYSIASDKSREVIDSEIDGLINLAYKKATVLILNSREIIDECAKLLMIEKTLNVDAVNKILYRK